MHLGSLFPGLACQYFAPLLALLVLFLCGCGTANIYAPAVNNNIEISGTAKPGAFDIQRIELVFSNQRPQITLDRNQALEATALIQYQGIGSFQANWTVAGRTLQQVNLSLLRGSLLKLQFNDKDALKGLPAGEHVLRLEPVVPSVFQSSLTELPKLRFFLKP